MTFLDFLGDPNWWSNFLVTLLLGVLVIWLGAKAMKFAARLLMTTTKKNREFWDHRVSLALREPIELSDLQANMIFNFAFAIMALVMGMTVGVVANISASRKLPVDGLVSFFIFTMFVTIVLIIRGTSYKIALRRVRDLRIAEVLRAEEDQSQPEVTHTP